MPQKLLYGAQVGAVCQQIGRERVPQIVRRGRRRYLGSVAVFFEDIFYAVFEFADSESATNFIGSTEVLSVVSDFANRIYLYGNMVIIGTISYEIMTQVYGLYPGMTCYQEL